MLSSEKLTELERQIEIVVRSFCEEDCLATNCVWEQCPIRYYLSYPEIVNSSGTIKLDRRVQELLNILDREWNKPLRVTDLASRVGLSVSRVEHLFKNETGTSLRNFIHERRVWYAAKFLKTTEMRISEIAYYVGFQDPSNFARAFRRKFGTSPTQFRSQP